MRYLEKCPACGQQENVAWLPSTWDVEKDVTGADNYPTGLPSDDPQWVYRYSKNGNYIIRLQRAVYVARGNKWSLNKRKDWDSNKKVLRKNQVRKPAKAALAASTEANDN